MLRRAIIGLAAAMLLSLPAPGAALAAERRIEISRDSDYPGFDLRTLKDVAQGQCEAACIADDACRAFTYNSRAKWCFLKSDHGEATPFAGAVAGRIVEADAEPDIGAPPKLSFVPAWLVQQAREQKARLELADNQRGHSADQLRQIARRELQAGNLDTALYNFKGALALTPEDGTLWAEFSRAGASAENNFSAANEAVQAGINAYQLSRSAVARADALATLATALAKIGNNRPALETYKASLALVDAKTVRDSLNDLRARQGFRVSDHRVDSDSASPRICVEFSEDLAKRVDYADFVTLDGAVPKALEAKDRQICVEDLTHGQRYRLALRRGLPSVIADEPLTAQVDLDVYVRDRAPSVRFTGENFVLPAGARRGIPLVAVNTERLELKLYRVGERAITPLVGEDQRFLSQLSGYWVGQIEQERGELVWQGSLDVGTELNRDVTSSFPVDEALPERKPGVYVLTARPENNKGEDWESRATQWFVVSDIGLTSFAGSDGLHVFAHSLGSARPLAGVELQLLAKNNEILGTAKTDDDGRAVFAAGLIRGSAGAVPAILTAARDGQDFVFLDMTRAGFDLSDRGVSGRAAPGAIDVMAFTERGIYRPGETVYASALARKSDAQAIDDLPLTFVFERPDGIEDRRFVSNGALGGHAVSLALLDAAQRGTWTLRVFADPKGAALAEQRFLVDDFVPDRIEFDLTSPVAQISVGEPFAVTVDGRFLYGAPAAGLALEGEIALKPVRESPAFPGYRFGLADAGDDETVRISLDGLAPTDGDGKAELALAVDEAPAVTQLVNADIVLRLREAGGRAVERSLTLPVRSDGERIGIRPEFSGDLGEGATAGFHVIVIDADGKRRAGAGLSWKLVKIERDYQWYRDGSSWRFEPVTRSRQVADGRFDAGAEGARLSVPVEWGRYRLEVESPGAEGSESSFEFNAGWFAAGEASETPDVLDVALDKASYRVGETAKLKVSTREGGQLLVAGGSDSLVAVKRAAIAAGGGEVEIPVTAEWGAGAYVSAVLYRPGDDRQSRLPARAIGTAWLKVDPQERDLDVAIEAAEQVLPRRPLDIAVKVDGAGAHEEAYVTVAAVDVGILNLTGYKAPAPEEWYFGQRRLGLEIRDIYGRLIDGSLGATGRLRSGGDGGIALQGDPPKEKLVAFFSGPVRLDGDGRARVSFDIPQFNGTARVMAVAWTRSGVGHGVKDVVVRDPVVVTASVARFLAPGDESRLRLDIANTDAPAGEYRLTALGNAAVSVAADGPVDVTLTQGGRSDIELPLKALAPGDGRVTIGLSRSDSAEAGEVIEQVLTIPVRPAALPLTERRLAALAPGATLDISGDVLADRLLPGAAVSIQVARSNDFDISGLLLGLDRYPYGCTEQVASKALPLIHLRAFAARTGLADEAEVAKRIEDAIRKVLANQSSDGGFGLWSPEGGGDLWLSAYVSDFLTRAREAGYDVPEQALVQALENLRNALGYEEGVGDRGNELAYSLYVLARNRKAAISDLRYYADTSLEGFRTPLSRAHLAAALSLYGDKVRAEALFTQAADLTAQAEAEPVSLSRSDYGSSLRDAAGVLALAAESRPVPAVVPLLASRVAREIERKRHLSTQEQAWALQAAQALQAGDDDIALTVNGSEHRGAFLRQIDGEALAADPVEIVNRTQAPLSVAITTVAVPVEPLPAGGDGFEISRRYFTLSGEETNVSEARQNERYVAVLSITETNAWASRIVVADLLPAGFEIDNPNLVSSANLANFDWIENVELAHSEFRSDRFVAAFDRSEGDNREIVLAYVVRAVTPGVYEHPAAVVEDMYRPQFSARTASGRMQVLAAE